MVGSVLRAALQLDFASGEDDSGLVALCTRQNALLYTVLPLPRHRPAPHSAAHTLARCTAAACTATRPAAACHSWCQTCQDQLTHCGGAELSSATPRARARAGTATVQCTKASPPSQLPSNLIQGKQCSSRRRVGNNSHSHSHSHGHGHSNPSGRSHPHKKQQSRRQRLCRRLCRIASDTFSSPGEGPVALTA